MFSRKGRGVLDVPNDDERVGEFRNKTPLFHDPHSKRERLSPSVYEVSLDVVPTSERGRNERGIGCKR